MAVKSAERVLRIFECLAGYPDGLTAKEVSTYLNYASSSTFELLKTLSENDYLIMDENKKYILGPKLIQLGVTASNYLNINKVARPYLQKLMEIVEETIFLAILSDDEVVYVDKIDSYKTISTNANVGSRKPIYCTGLGKAFLAFMPEKARDKIIEKIEIKAITSHTVTNKEKLLDKVNKYKKLGYAVDNEEIEVGLCCVAAPIYNESKKMVAAISVSGPKERMSQKKQLIVKTILEISKEISIKLGCTY